MNNDKNHIHSFQEAYDLLNSAQREAVDTVAGPVMVIAGPGTGKTQILTLRIVNILRLTDTAPEQILALTFTESGVKAMRQRLVRYLGSTAYRVSIHTFHGFAQQLINNFPDAFPRIIGGRPISAVESSTLMENILRDTAEAHALRPTGDPGYYVKPVLGAINDLKKEYINPDSFDEILEKSQSDLSKMERYHSKGAHKGKIRSAYLQASRRLEKDKALGAVYRVYEECLNKKRLYDFSDMLMETVHVLSNDEYILRELQETHQYLLADEHQDSNGSQNRILELLASYHERPDLFVVGDEKQAIFRFQGASLENFLFFQTRFPDTKVISLTDNYRSGQPILDLSHKLIEVTEGPLAPLRVRLNSFKELPATIDCLEFNHTDSEMQWVADKIKELLAKGTPASEVAVILRRNKDVERYGTFLRQCGIAIRQTADTDLLNALVIRRAMELLRAITHPEDEHVLASLLHAPYWRISAHDLFKIFKAGTTVKSLSQLIAYKSKLEMAGVVDVGRVARVGEVLQEARDNTLTSSPQLVLARAVEGSGLLAMAMKQDPIESGRVLRRLYDEVEAMVKNGVALDCREVVDALNSYSVYGLALNAPDVLTSEAEVTVMTAHRSKGLEFNSVFIAQLVDSQWGGGKSRSLFSTATAHSLQNTEDKLEDEKRLLYVSMTRAKQELFLTFAKTDQDNRDYLPSRLLADMPIQTKSGPDIKDADMGLSKFRHPSESPVWSVNFLRDVLMERGVSATALNNYIKSPWTYLYRNVLRIPEVKTMSLQYGSVMHKVLEYMTKSHGKDAKWPTLDECVGQLETLLKKFPLTESERSLLKQKGSSSLEVYREHMVKSVTDKTVEEVRLTALLPTGLEKFPEIKLTGSLDRVDVTAEGGVVRVVDYKTGKPKSRNAIEGKTKQADAGYKRQLQFYALLLSLQEDKRWHSRNTVLSFIEPNERGKIKEEEFVISDEEIEEVKQDIISMVADVSSGTFLTNVPCDTNDCDYCYLAEELITRLPLTD